MERQIRNKKVLVTGGAGFIGSNLCQALVNQENEVVCLDNFLTGKKDNIISLTAYENFKLIEGDIRNIKACEEAVKGVDIILHQAALGSIPRSIKDPATTNAINVDGFINVLIAAKNAGVKRIVYASSSSVYGSSKKLPKIEEDIGEPLSPYAITKRVNELYAKVFADIYGMTLIGLRYFNVYGIKQDSYSTYAAVIPKFVSTLIKYESPVINGDGSFSRDFTYIDDVIQINQLAALTNNEEAYNQVFNVAVNDRNTINTLFDIIKENLASLDSEVSTIRPVYGPGRPGDIPHSLASIEKAQKLLAYKPENKLKDGIKKTIKWYFDNLK